jgi:hypothetical protein
MEGRTVKKGFVPVGRPRWRRLASGMTMTSGWRPFREPARITILRTGLIAIVGGGVMARYWGGLAHWPRLTLLVLWPSYGGHWVEVWFLNWLRPRLPVTRGMQVAARVLVWFVGGVGLMIGMGLTTKALDSSGWILWRARWPAWWLGGLAFIGVELVAHLVLRLRGRPNFYDGRA